jgi:hypothetical protein
MKTAPSTLDNSRTGRSTATACVEIMTCTPSTQLDLNSLVDCHAGEGKLIFANGEFRGIFNNGKHVDGQFVFSDGLVYVEDDWKYCTSADRRLHAEMKE